MVLINVLIIGRPAISKIHYFYDGDEEVTEKEVNFQDVYDNLFANIKAIKKTHIFAFSDSGGNSNYAHHKSFLVLNENLQSGFVLLHTYPEFHNNFIENTPLGVSHTQHMICISLESKIDVDTLLKAYNIIKPNLQFYKGIDDKVKEAKTGQNNPSYRHRYLMGI
ncbi:hypothetical protein DLAC_11485 [Tieghemostelium lacteum]|uniref:Uncharacterized protein n=1 Tax=Tieghemostelium lacteum TaxID=361077 RepID=A0A152A667_TIELA|nr:hypothetical protein DLAC_11485 [Tieghemostelium lacteum]|eukprot:KYR01605.1 hypothetical protein DLAC_11485 [Tieghemostelium lacteum]